MAKTIKLDQSHCNFAFSAQLRLSGWSVLFRDPGRSSRGLSAQEGVLGVFERNGWPIPDILAVRNGIVLLVEVDHRYELCTASMLTYRGKSMAMIAELNSLRQNETPLCKLQLCFCKIGRIRNPQALLDQILELAAA